MLQLQKKIPSKQVNGILHNPASKAHWILLMMEQSDSVECHNHSVSVGSLNYEVIANRSAWLGDNSNTRLLCAVDVVAEWEKGI